MNMIFLLDVGPNMLYLSPHLGVTNGLAIFRKLV